MISDISQYKKAGATISIGGAISVAALIGITDQRYAQASDVQELTAVIQLARTDNLENCVREAEKDIRMVELVPDEERTEWLKYLYSEAVYRKERCIRKLERINAELSSGT